MNRRARNSFLAPESESMITAEQAYFYYASAQMVRARGLLPNERKYISQINNDEKRYERTPILLRSRGLWLFVACE